jgi:hypothetical protein
LQSAYWRVTDALESLTMGISIHSMQRRSMQIEIA